MTKDDFRAANDDEDQELARLERELEMADASSHPDSNSVLQQQHGDAYRIIDQLAAPIRSAIFDHKQPPQIPDYDELTEIGRGGMGIVYRGYHNKMQRLEAVKIIRRDRLAGMTGEAVKMMQLRFQQESKLAAQIAHEHIVPIYQVGEIADVPWFSMQFVEGQDLRSLSDGGGLNAERAVRYLEAVARAIDVIHRHGIIHGDIKPHNILIERETDRPLISDFGLADLDIQPANALETGVVGTPAYMAPELANAALPDRPASDVARFPSVATDIYSLGVTLWTTLTGDSPVDQQLDANAQLSVIADGNHHLGNTDETKIPPALKPIVAKCTAANPNSRYASAAELADDLAAWLDRPRWHRHFPKLATQLWMIVAPSLLAGGILTWWLLEIKAAEGWVWLAILSGYVPLFATLLASYRAEPAAARARRELWSIWIGHLVSTCACLLVVRILCHPDYQKSIEISYPCLACLSSLAFFAKSGNFWSSYRWIGMGWALAAIAMTFVPSPPILFGVFAALTCVVIAKCDPSFRENSDIRDAS